MPLTPITINKRNTKTLNFAGPFLTLTNPVASAFLIGPSVNCPYPQISNGGTATDSNYQAAFLLADGTIIGNFYNVADLTQLSGKAAALSADKSTITLAYGASPNIWEKSFAADSVAYTIGPNALPQDNSFAYQAGMSGITNRDTFVNVYTLGSCFPALRDDGSGVTGLYAVMDNLGTWHNAFKNEADGPNIYPSGGMVTLNDGVWNYTAVIASPIIGDNAFYVSKWQPNAYNPAGAFTYTNLGITLSDASDNADFQAFMNWNTFFGDRYLNGNTEAFIISCDNGASPIGAQTVFVIAKDLSWYDRIDITVDNVIGYGNYFQDIDGNDYFLGTDAGSNLLAQINPTPVSAGEPGYEMPTQVFSLGCWSPCNNLLVQRNS